MLPKTRVIAALEFKRPDRIPVGETGVDYTITEQALGRPTLYRAKWKEYTAICGRAGGTSTSPPASAISSDLARKLRARRGAGFPGALAPPAAASSRSSSAPTAGACPDGRVFAYSPESEGHQFLLSNPRGDRGRYPGDPGRAWTSRSSSWCGTW